MILGKTWPRHILIRFCEINWFSGCKGFYKLSNTPSDSRWPRQSSSDQWTRLKSSFLNFTPVCTVRKQRKKDNVHRMREACSVWRHRYLYGWERMGQERNTGPSHKGMDQCKNKDLGRKWVGILSLNALLFPAVLLITPFRPLFIVKSWKCF